MSKKSLSRIASNSAESTFLFPEDGLRCRSESVMGQLVSFFIRNPDESFTWEDLLVKFEGQAATHGISLALKVGVKTGVFTLDSGHDELTVYPGPNVNRVELLGPAVGKSSQVVMYSNSVQHRTVLRFKANPGLIAPAKDVCGRGVRVASTLRFALASNLLELFVDDNGVRSVRAGSALANFNVPVALPDPKKSSAEPLSEEEVLEKFVTDTSLTYPLQDMGLTTETVLTTVPNILRSHLVDLFVGDSDVAYLRAGPALPKHVARHDLMLLEALNKKLSLPRGWSGYTVTLTDEEHAAVRAIVGARVRVAAKVLDAIAQTADEESVS